MKFKNNIQTPEAEFNQSETMTFSSLDIDYLKKKTQNSPRNRYRICLHYSTDHRTQEMIICLKGFNYFRPHKHAQGCSESYHMLEGALDIYFFDDNGKVINVVKLASPNFENRENRDVIYRLSASLYHLVIPRTEWTIFHEVSTGPFNKNNFTKLASFAPTEDSDSKKIIEYCNKATNNNIYLL